jgi:hypothetical protein
MFHHRLLVGIVVCGGLLSSSRVGQAAPGVGPEFALTTEPQESPEWYAPAARETPVLTTPSGHVVTIYPCTFYPCPVLGQDIVRVLDVTTTPATTLATGSVTPPPSSAVAASRCGMDDCLEFALAEFGVVTVQRFDLATYTWIDTTPVTVSSVPDDNASMDVPTIASNGTTTFVCWEDLLDLSPQSLKCVTRTGRPERDLVHGRVVRSGARLVRRI